MSGEMMQIGGKLWTMATVEEHARKQRGEEMKTFEVWTEGFSATGESGDATFHGEFEGKTFREAVNAYIATDPEYHNQYYDAKRLTYWGCRFFDNESDARKSFG
jgi:hypothetical protein